MLLYPGMVRSRVVGYKIQEQAYASFFELPAQAFERRIPTEVAMNFI
jgi:hypothetical protein